MKINRRTTESLGWSVLAVDGWSDGPKTQREIITIPGRAGVAQALYASGQERTITATLFCRPEAVAFREAYLSRLLDATHGAFWVSFDDRPTQQVRAIRTGWRVEAPSAAIYAHPEAYVTLTMRIPDGIALDTSARVVSLPSAGTVSLPIGTAPSLPLVTLSGAWTALDSRTLTLTAPSGVTLSTLVLTAPTGQSLAAVDSLEVDMNSRTITKVTGAGVRTNAYAWKASGAFFGIDPADAQRDGQSWPRLTVSAGVGVVTYVRGWGL
jgi:hypothetical protein